jgi:hypothetical protein
MKNVYQRQDRFDYTLVQGTKSNLMNVERECRRKMYHPLSVTYLSNQYLNYSPALFIFDPHLGHAISLCSFPHFMQ